MSATTRWTRQRTLCGSSSLANHHAPVVITRPTAGLIRRIIAAPRARQRRHLRRGMMSGRRLVATGRTKRGRRRRVGSMTARRHPATT